MRIIRNFLVVAIVAYLLPGHIAAQGPDHLVTGSALITFTGDAEQHWQFSARVAEDGSVAGQLQLYTSQVNGGRLHGSLVCATSDPSTGVARLAALVDRSTTPLAPEGSYLIWTVQDNGPGEPDRTSDLHPVGATSATFHCATGFTLPMYTSDRGEIIVHQ